MTTTHATPAEATAYEDDTGSGWVDFAALMLAIAGVMRFFDALWAFRYHGQLPDNLENALFGHSLKTYGWIYLGVTVVLLASAWLLSARRSQVARWVGVAAGAIAAITSIWLIQYYPVWGLIYVGLGALVVYALVVHGKRPARS